LLNVKENISILGLLWGGYGLKEKGPSQGLSQDS